MMSLPNYVKNEKGEHCWVALVKLTPELRQRLEVALVESDGKVEVEVEGGVTLQVFDWKKHRDNHPIPPTTEYDPRFGPRSDPRQFSYFDTPRYSTPWRDRERSFVNPTVKLPPLVPEIDHEALHQRAQAQLKADLGFSVHADLQDLWRMYEDKRERTAAREWADVFREVEYQPDEVIGRTAAPDQIVVFNSPSVAPDASDLKLTIHKKRETSGDLNQTWDQAAWNRAAGHSGIGKPAVGDDAGFGSPSAPKGVEYVEAKFPSGEYNSDAGRVKVIDTSFNYETGARSYKIRYHGSSKSIDVTEHYLKTMNLRALR